MRRPHNWKAGQSGNPKGAPVTPAEIKALRVQKTLEIIQIIGKFSAMKTKDLGDYLHSPDITALESLMGTLWTKSINGSPKHAELIMERLAGAVPKTVVTLDEDGNEKPIGVNINPDKLLAIMVKLQELPEDQPCNLIQNLLERSPASLPPPSPPPSGTES